MLNEQKALLKKRQLAQPVLKKQTITPVFYSTTSKPVNRLLFEIIALLKQQTVPIGNQEIIRKTTIDVLGNQELLHAILQNDRVIYDRQRQTFAYQPTFLIRNEADLLKVLKDNRGVQCLEIKELEESFVDSRQLITNLDSQLILIHGKEGPKSVYCKVRDKIDLNSDIIDMWHAIDAPLDIVKELKSANLVPIVNQKEQAPTGPKTKKKAKRTRFRLTNTHLKGVDLTQN